MSTGNATHASTPRQKIILAESGICKIYFLISPPLPGNRLLSGASFKKREFHEPIHFRKPIYANRGFEDAAHESKKFYPCP
jgi:hypothetical protein